MITRSDIRRFVTSAGLAVSVSGMAFAQNSTTPPTAPTTTETGLVAGTLPAGTLNFSGGGGDGLFNTAGNYAGGVAAVTATPGIFFTTAGNATLDVNIGNPGFNALANLLFDTLGQAAVTVQNTNAEVFGFTAAQSNIRFNDGAVNYTVDVPFDFDGALTIIEQDGTGTIDFQDDGTGESFDLTTIGTQTVVFNVFGDGFDDGLADDGEIEVTNTIDATNQDLLVLTGGGELELLGNNAADAFNVFISPTTGTLVVTGGAAIADTATVFIGSSAANTFVINDSEAIGELTGGDATFGTGSIVNLDNGQVLTIEGTGANVFSMFAGGFADDGTAASQFIYDPATNGGGGDESTLVLTGDSSTANARIDAAGTGLPNDVFVTTRANVLGAAPGLGATDQFRIESGRLGIGNNAAFGGNVATGDDGAVLIINSDGGDTPTLFAYDAAGGPLPGLITLPGSVIVEDDFAVSGRNELRFDFDNALDNILNFTNANTETTIDLQDADTVFTWNIDAPNGAGGPVNVADEFTDNGETINFVGDGTMRINNELQNSALTGTYFVRENVTLTSASINAATNPGVNYFSNLSVFNNGIIDPGPTGIATPLGGALFQVQDGAGNTLAGQFQAGTSVGADGDAADATVFLIDGNAADGDATARFRVRSTTNAAGAINTSTEALAGTQSTLINVLNTDANGGDLNWGGIDLGDAVVVDAVLDNNYINDYINNAPGNGVWLGNVTDTNGDGTLDFVDFDGDLQNDVVNAATALFDAGGANAAVAGALLVDRDNDGIADAADTDGDGIFEFVDTDGDYIIAETDTPGQQSVFLTGDRLTVFQTDGILAANAGFISDENGNILADPQNQPTNAPAGSTFVNLEDGIVDGGTATDVNELLANQANGNGVNGTFLPSVDTDGNPNNGVDNTFVVIENADLFVEQVLEFYLASSNTDPGQEVDLVAVRQQGSYTNASINNEFDDVASAIWQLNNDAQTLTTNAGAGLTNRNITLNANGTEPASFNEAANIVSRVDLLDGRVTGTAVGDYNVALEQIQDGGRALVQSFANVQQLNERVNYAQTDYLAARRAGNHAVALAFGGSDLQSLAAAGDPELINAAMEAETFDAQEPGTRLSDNPFGLYVKGFGIFEEQDDSSSVTGYEADGGGVTVGFDYAFTDDFLLGLYFTYNATDVDFEGGLGDLDIDTFRFGPYLTYSFFDGWFIDLQTTFGFHEIESVRNTPSLGFSNDADYDAFDFTFFFGIGYDFQFGTRDQFRVTPEFSVQYTYYDQDSFSESGVGGLSIEENEANLVNTRLGVRFAYVFETDTVLWIPEVSGGWDFEAGDDIDDLEARFNAGTATFSTEVDTGDESAGYVGAGMTAVFDNNVSIFVRYDGQFAGDNTVNAVGGGIGFRF
ncbi:MAG: autotransporter outer membrane beta-barrel domain-containing protein [Planctomycetota bacterium]